MTYNNPLSVFRKGIIGSVMTYLFFPPHLRQKMTALYAYIEAIDSFESNNINDIKSFDDYYQKTELAWQGKKTNISVINNFITIAKAESFEKKWIDALLDSKRIDLTKKHYTTYGDLEQYMYGSANVIGIMIARLMDLPHEAYSYAELQCKAIRLIIIIHRIKADLDLGCEYIPIKDQTIFKIKNLNPQTQKENSRIERLIRFEIERYQRIQQDAELGYKYIPRKFLIPIKTIAQICNWTAHQIYRNPRIVYSENVEPKKIHILWRIFNNIIAI